MKWYCNKIGPLLFVWIFVIYSSNAQVALKMGGNIATLSSDDDNNSKSGFLFRYHMGAVLQPIRIADGWYFEPELLLSWKGQKYNYDITVLNSTGTKYIRHTQYKNKFTYFEIPLMFEKGLYEKVSLEFGPYLSLRIAGKKSGTTKVTTIYTDNSSNVLEFPENEKYSSLPSGTDATRPLESFDIGFNIGAQYHWKEGINFGLRYNFGLIDITKDNYPVSNANTNHESNQVIQLYVSYYLGD